MSDIKVYICTPATLEAEFLNGVGVLPAGASNPSVNRWITSPFEIQHMVRNLTN